MLAQRLTTPGEVEYATPLPLRKGGQEVRPTPGGYGGRPPTAIEWRHGSTGFGPDRGHRGVGHARRRRQGKGAQGGRTAGDRLRRRRARLPDPGSDRRGG